MEALATVAKQAELALQPTEERTLAVASGTQLPVPQVHALGRWMAETQANYPNQELPDGTPDMWLAQWQEMAAQHGLDVFRLALLRAIRDSKFFPPPDKIREECIREIAEQNNQRGSEKYLSRLAGWKERWEGEKGLPAPELSEAEREAEKRIQERLAAVRDRKRV